MTSLKSPNMKSRIKVTLDSQSLRRLSLEHNHLITYTILTFFVVLTIYFLTKDWKGFTSPEEIDLGSIRIAPRTPYHRKSIGRST